MVSWISTTCVFLAVVLRESSVWGQTTVAAPATTEDPSVDVNKAVISIGVLAAILIISIIIAKIVDYCYDRATLRDDASDISEDTRKLIRARIALNKFKAPKKKKSEKEAKKNTIKIFRLWSKRAKSRGSLRRSSSNLLSPGETKQDHQLRLNEDLKKTLPKVTFIDEVHGDGSADLSTPVFTITVPDLKAPEPKSQGMPDSPEQRRLILKDNIATTKNDNTVPLLNSVNDNLDETYQPKVVSLPSDKRASGKNSPSKDNVVEGPADQVNVANVTNTAARNVYSRSSPFKESSGRETSSKDSSDRNNTGKDNAGKHTPVKPQPKPGGSTSRSVAKTPGHPSALSPPKQFVALAPFRSRSSKDLTKKETARSQSGGARKSGSGGSRPNTAPSPGPQSNKIVNVKSVSVKKTSSSPTKDTDRSASAKTPKTPVNNKPSGAHSAVDTVTVSSRTATSLSLSTDDDGRGDMQKKYVHFRGDAGDLLIPVSTDEKPKVEPKSFEKI